MDKRIKYIILTFAVLIGIVLLTISASFIYFTTHKQELITKAKKQISDKINGNVQIENIEMDFIKNFPQVSLLLKNVSITDTMYSIHKQPLLTAENIYLILSVTNIISSDNPLTGIRIDNGKIYVFTDTTGYTNEYLFSPKKTTDTAATTAKNKTDIESIKLRNVRIVMDNKLKHKLYDFEAVKVSWKIKDHDSVLIIKTKNNIIIHNFAFNTEIGSYAKESSFEGDFKLSYHKPNKQLSFDDIPVQLKKQPFNFTGQFNFTENPSFSLSISTRNINYEFAKSLLTAKLSKSVSIVSIDKPITQITADISGPLKGGLPLVNVAWQVNDANVKSKFANFTNCTLQGSFTNEVTKGVERIDPNSRIEFHHIKAKYKELPFSSENVFITNLTYPQLQCDVLSAFDLSALNNIIGNNTLTIKKGKGNIQLTYNGPLENNTKGNTLINGKVNFSNGTLLYNPRKLQLDNASGNIVFKNTDVNVTDFKGTLQGNTIYMNGIGKNLLALVETNPGLLLLDWNIYSPSLNLNFLNALLKKKTTTINTSNTGSISTFLDIIVAYASFRIKIKADELMYKKFKATKVDGLLSLANENWAINKIELQHAGGHMQISGKLEEANSKRYNATIGTTLSNVDVNKVMYAFNNFGQKGIEFENLKGKLSSNSIVNFSLDRETEQPSNLNGYVDFSLKNGALLHYEPLKKVQSVIFKKRNFDEVQFAELKDRIDINNNVFTINRMEIQSTALTLFVEGVYNPNGNSDISIQVPISNLKKRGDDYIPVNKGAEQKGGASIYLRGVTGSDGQVAFKLDVFKKLRKNKKDKKE